MYKYTLQLDFEGETSHGLLVKNIPDRSKILEFGCSDGQLAEYVKDKKGCSVFGIDISKTAVDAAMPHLVGGLVANLERDDWQTPLADKEFDVLLFSDVLEHLTDPVKVLSDALKFLKDDGRVLFSVPNIAHGDVILKLLAQRFDYTSHGLLDDTHVHFFSKENLADFCERSGLFLSELNATYCPVGSSEQAYDTDPRLKGMIEGCLYTDVYQYVCVAYKSEYAKSHCIKRIDKVREPKRSIFVFFDYGNGFSAENSLMFDAKEIGGELDFTLPKNTRHVRIDLSENGGYVLKRCSFACDEIPISPAIINNVTKIGDTDYFLKDDPQHIFAIRNGAKKFHASFEVCDIFADDSYSKFLEDIYKQTAMLSDKTKELDFMKPHIEKISKKVEAISDELDAKLGHFASLSDKVVNLSRENDVIKSQNKSLREENVSLKENNAIKATEIKTISYECEKLKKNADKNQAELEKYKSHYFAAIKQRTELQARVAELEAMYSCISRSACWRMTKPLRVVLDLIKKPLRKVKLFRLIRKGLRCLRENGFKYTWRKMKNYRKNRQNLSSVLKPIYTEEEMDAQRKYKFSKNTRISILVPLYNTPEQFLHEMIRSVLDQTYGNWELCLADGSDAKHQDVEHICKKYAHSDSRIKYVKLEKNLGISENTNACIDMSTGDFIALFDHDDLLHPSALYNVMTEICENDADFIYTDEATFESPDVNKIITVHCKPDYAVDNLRANNYICHLSVFSRTVLEKSGKFRHEYDGSQDHDMILRLTENATKIVHIPKILYFWRSHPMSVAMDINSKTYAIDAGKRAVRDSILRSGYNATVESSRAFPTIYKINYELKSTPKVSIIIPNKNHKSDLEKCLDSIRNSTYPSYEIIIIDNGSTDNDVLEYYEDLKKEPNIKITSLDIPFNYSKLNNEAVKIATGDYYILLNNDIEIITPDWIEEMLMYAQRNDVGAVGAMLYYDDDTIQHAGVILKLGAQRIAGHAFNRVHKQELGYMGRLCYAQNMSAVTAACLMVKASVYNEVNGFDENLGVAYNDVDFCTKIRQKGHLIVWTPYAEAYHYESKSRGYENESPEKIQRYNKEVEYFKNKWKHVLEKGDPYYNPNFSLDTSTFDLAPQNEI